MSQLLQAPLSNLAPPLLLSRRRLRRWNAALQMNCPTERTGLRRLAASGWLAHAPNDSFMTSPTSQTAAAIRPPLPGGEPVTVVHANRGVQTTQPGQHAKSDHRRTDDAGRRRNRARQAPKQPATPARPALQATSALANTARQVSARNDHIQHADSGGKSRRTTAQRQCHCTACPANFDTTRQLFVRVPPSRSPRAACLSHFRGPL